MECDELGTSFCDVNHSMEFGESLVETGIDELGTSFQDSGEDPLPLFTSTPDKWTNLGKVSAQGSLKTTKQLSTFIMAEIGKSTGRLQDKALSRTSMYSCLEKSCKCNENCLSKFTFEDVRNSRMSYWKNTTNAIRKEILCNFCNKSSKHGKQRLFTITNKIVCSLAFQIIMNIDKNTITRAMRNLSASLRVKRPSSNTLTAVNWFEDYVSVMADRMPNSSDLLLPYKMQIQSVYLQYTSEVLDKPVSRSQFRKIWKSHFPHVKIKQTNSFSKCTTCTTLEKKWENTRDITQKAQYRKLKEEHYARQQLERRYYYAKRDRSRSQPDKFMSIIVDGMDQSKTNLPHFAGRRSKSINAADLLKTHVTGVINHGHGGVSTYLDINEYPHDPNLTINVLVKTIEKTSISMGQKLPPCLYIQADNCSRENKNRYVLGFLEYLVAENIFSEVHLSFLIVGHTHEDVDAAFSRISCKLAKTDAETLQNLQHILPQSEYLDNLFDYKCWLEPCLVNVSRITNPLHYRFSKINEEVHIAYKGKCKNAWIALDGHFLAKKPSGLPLVLQPNYEKVDTVKLMKQVDAVKVLFNNETSYEQWKVFSDSVTNFRFDNGSFDCPLMKLPHQERLEDIAEPVIDETVQSLVDKETKIPEVVVPKKHRRK